LLGSSGEERDPHKGGRPGKGPLNELARVLGDACSSGALASTMMPGRRWAKLVGNLVAHGKKEERRQI
jgi:hypothetical protein